MARGKALKYVGDRGRLYDGVPLGDLSPAAQDRLPPEWPADVLVASGDWEWASQDEVAPSAGLEVVTPTPVAAPADHTELEGPPQQAPRRRNG